MSIETTLTGALAEAKLWAKNAKGLPQSPYGYLFPVQAISIAGQLIFRDGSWVGNEMRLGSMQLSGMPDLADNMFDEDVINETRQRYQGHFLVSRSVIQEVGGVLDGDHAFTKANWHRTKASVGSHFEAWASAKARLNLVVNHLGRMAEAGLIRTVYRKKGGGEEPTRVPTAWWGLDDFTPRFKSCALNPDMPSKVSGTLPAWFFLEETGVRDTSASPEVALEVSSTTIEGVHLSPYLQLMIDVARATGIGPEPEQQVAVESLYFTIREMAAARGIDIKQGEWMKMATFVREPGSKVGSRKLKADQRSQEAKPK